MTATPLRIRARWLGIGLSAALWAMPVPAAFAAPDQIPSVVETPTSEHHVGKMIWADLVTPDLEGAKRFYTALFGWTFRDVPTGPSTYAVASLDGRPVAGVLGRAARPDEHRQPAWLTFIAVSDVDAAKATAMGHGAKVLLEPKTFPSRGRQAVFADPDGAVFAVLASSRGDPADFLAAPGEWIWSSLLASDPNASAAFYQTLLGYEVYDLETEGGADHLILSTDDYARASVVTLPAGSHRHPHWLNFVRVLDTASAAAKVTALGGRVLVQPHLDRHGGMVAVVADPAGAPFGLMEWTDSDTKVEPK
jgi:predicted enzyme related to lactoylglutathione lyase